MNFKKKDLKEEDKIFNNFMLFGISFSIIFGVLGVIIGWILGGSLGILITKDNNKDNE